MKEEKKNSNKRDNVEPVTNTNSEVREIDVSKIDLERLGLAVAKNPGLMEFAHSLSSGNIAPLKECQVRARSHQAMLEQLEVQKKQIFKQLRLLADQVQELNERQKVSEDVYRAKMTFDPVIGQTYYLYQNEKERFLSMISPSEWDLEEKRLSFISAVTLMGDRTWKVESLKEDDQV